MKNKKIRMTIKVKINFKLINFVIISLVCIIPYHSYGQTNVNNNHFDSFEKQNEIKISKTNYDVYKENSEKISARIKHIRFGSTSDPLNGLTITWQSIGNYDNIKWGYTNAYEKGTALGIKRSGYENNFFDYHFPNLEANSTIYYRLFDSSAGEWTAEMTYSTASEINGSKFSFLAMGDSRTYVEDWHDVSIAANVNKTDFTLFMGDIVADGSVPEDWNNWFEYGEDFIANNLVYHSIGNHECKGNGEEVYPNVFVLPENVNGSEYYYSFTFGNAVFICLDSEEFETGSLGYVQNNWLINILSENSDKTWKIVWFHRPFYTTGSHAGEMNDKMDTWFDTFDTFGVDLIFNGHDHMYERTKPVQKNGKVVSEYGSKSEHGRCQVVCGGAGAPLYAPGSASWLETAAKKFHYCKIDIDGNNLSFKVFDETNTQFDALELYKNYTVSASENQVNTRINLYPNPTNSEITVYGDQTEISEIRIFNLQGQDFSSFIKQKSKSESEIQIDLSKLPTGLYLLKTKTNTHKVFVK